MYFDNSRHKCPTRRSPVLITLMNMENPEFDIENVPEFIRPYFEAKKKGTLPQYYLNIFKHVRDNYLDDLKKDDFRYVHGEFTTQEEIDMINQILADVIQYLEQ